MVQIDGLEKQFVARWLAAGEHIRRTGFQARNFYCFPQGSGTEWERDWRVRSSSESSYT